MTRHMTRCKIRPEYNAEILLSVVYDVRGFGKIWIRTVTLVGLPCLKEAKGSVVRNLDRVND